MFIFVLMFALARADLDDGNFLPDFGGDESGSFLLRTSDIIPGLPILPAAQVHTVNWQIPVVPNHITINLGDSVQFNWVGIHGVVMFPSNIFASTCAVNAATYLSPVKNGGSYTWTSSSIGDFYFACPVNNGGHCMQGMMLWVSVVNPPSSAIAFTGDLAINWGLPSCSICGASCLTAANFLGVCNSNFNCVAPSLFPPVCGPTCPALSCGISPICLSPNFLFTPSDASGCPTCPVCTSNPVPCIGEGCLPFPCCPLIIPQGFTCRQC
jgi:plastocyanin